MNLLDALTLAKNKKKSLFRIIRDENGNMIAAVEIFPTDTTACCLFMLLAPDEVKSKNVMERWTPQYNDLCAVDWEVTTTVHPLFLTYCEQKQIPLFYEFDKADDI